MSFCVNSIAGCKWVVAGEWAESPLKPHGDPADTWFAASSPKPQEGGAGVCEPPPAGGNATRPHP
jgi:hypothetical protein